MNEETKSKWTQLRGDGSSHALAPEKFTALKDEFKQIATDAGRSVNDRRSLAEDTRFNRWAGQSPDGKKHDDAVDGVKAFPFDGASDARVRLSDGIIQEQVIVIMASLMRMQISASPTEGTDAPFAANVSVLWNWLQKNQLGAEWVTEWTKVAQWRQGDSPGIGYMQAWWHQADALKPVHLTMEELGAKAAEAFQGAGVQMTPEDMTDLQDLLVNVAREEELAGMVGAIWPKMTKSRAKKVAAEILTKQETEFAYPYTCENRLRIKARRLMDDIFVPENTPTDLQRARVVFVREWFSEPELREMDAAGAFEDGFLDELLKHQGETGWKQYSSWVEGEHVETPAPREWDKNRQRGQFELLTAFFRASNTMGIPGVYSVQFSAVVEKPGSKCELFDSRNKYPFFASPREILTDNQWDTRGISELSSTEQSSLKLLHDAFMDHAQLTTVPPVKVPASRPKLSLIIRPLGQIKEVRPGEISYMNPPAFPVSNETVQQNIHRRVERYYGQMTAEASPDWVRLYQQSLVDFFLLTVTEVIRYGLELAWEYLDDATLARVLGQEVPRSADDDVLRFDVQIGFEAGMLSLEYIEKVATMIVQLVLPADTMSTVKRDKLVQWLFRSISPTLAQELLVPAEEANQKEVDDEENNFAKIAAGVEPAMMTAGQNFGLRLQTLLGLGQKNPEAVNKLTPKSREIYEARMKHLHGQVEQIENAQIGRQMARPALQPAVPGGAAAA